MNPASRLRRSLSARVARPLAQRGRLLLDAARVGLHPTTGKDPDEKGVRQRVAENVRWAARHGEVNDYYYLYGLHRDGAPPPDDFLSVREMMFMIGRQVRDEKAQGVAGRAQGQVPVLACRASARLPLPPRASLPGL